MIRLGIVGSNYGRNVLLPAFRIDRRCQVVAIAGSDPAKTIDIARQSDIPHAFGRWPELVDADNVDAIAIATPPSLQPDIAIAALKNGKPIFLEKPLAADLTAARKTVQAAETSKRIAMMDFEFLELDTWCRARALIADRALGTLRHVMVRWNVENYATRMRLDNWKTNGAEGGGALGNFVSHSLYYLEDFCGPMTGLSARLFGLPGERVATESTVALAASFQSGAALSLAMSSASYLGSGHRIEFYGEDGTLVLANPTTDYMRGFELHFARRPADKLECLATDPIDSFPDGRIVPVSRLASRFLDAIENNTQTKPGIHDGYRVQQLTVAARRSHATGAWIDVTPERIAAEINT